MAAIPKVWFVSDTHFRHKNITLHHPGRALDGGFDPADLDAHDGWLKELWNSVVGKDDDVYVLGDFSFGSRDWTVRLLHQLHGRKNLILGNHDKSSEHLDNLFKTIYQVRNVVFKKTVYPYLDDNFDVAMCHYPLVTWNHKHHGAVHIHGHCHGSLDAYNKDSRELRVDIGFDGTLAKHGFIELHDLYDYFKGVSGGLPFQEYNDRLRKEKQEERFNEPDKETALWAGENENA